MRSKALTIGFVLVVSGSVTGTFLSSVKAQVNSYTNSANGKWEDSTNWSFGGPPASTQSIFITNAITKTVTIDATTTNSPFTLTINDLTVSAPAGSTNTLFLNN